MKHKHVSTRTGFIILGGICLCILIAAVYAFHITSLSDDLAVKSQEGVDLKGKNSDLDKKLSAVRKDLTDLKNQDQYKINQQNQDTIKHIEDTYQQAVSTYQKLLDLKTVSKDTKDMDDQFAKSLSQLSEKNYSAAGDTLIALNQSIDKEQAKIAAANAPAQGVPANAQNIGVNNAPPGNGFSRQNVNTDKGTFLVDIISGDLGSTRIIVDTASDTDCANDCPVLSLGDYVGRNGAYAGINGSYFCPASYPSCAGKTNSFDLLLMNKNKHYFNSANNVYSNNPAVIFGSGFIRFVGSASGWGRDTGVDGVLSNFPLLVSGGNSVYSDNPDPKFNSKGPRGFIANKGNTAYIGFVYNATMGESAATLKALGMENAMNLDEGGSTALWYGGYKAGPGRNIPNAILFVRK